MITFGKEVFPSSIEKGVAFPFGDADDTAIIFEGRNRLMPTENALALPPRTQRLILALAAIVLLAFALQTARAFRVIDPMSRQEDVYFSYLEGKRIVEGVNPYSRIHAGDMRINDKYATYFPGFYLLSALSQTAGARDPETWFALWRPVFVFFFLSIGGLVFWEGYRRRGAAFALFGTALWFFNRWTLYVIMVGHIDFPPLFFFLLSLAIFDKRPRTALVLFGVSLALKQIAIFAAPLYLIWAWQTASENKRFRSIGMAAIYIAIVPLACAIPFLLWDASGFVKSVLFSATRTADVHSAALSIDQVWGWKGLVGRAPLLFILLMLYVATAQRKIGRYVGAMCVMLAFNLMNPVFFEQYFCWAMPLVPLAFCDKSIPILKNP
jgi:hypothetical protein